MVDGYVKFWTMGPGRAANPAQSSSCRRASRTQCEFRPVQRIIQVSIGAPYDGFARDMARLFAAGAPLGEIVAAANKHGVQLG